MQNDEEESSLNIATLLCSLLFSLLSVCVSMIDIQRLRSFEFPNGGAKIGTKRRMIVAAKK